MILEILQKKKECEILKKEIKKIEFQKNLKDEENRRKIESLKSENEKLKKQILEFKKKIIYYKNSYFA